MGGKLLLSYGEWGFRAARDGGGWMLGRDGGGQEEGNKAGERRCASEP